MIRLNNDNPKFVIADPAVLERNKERRANRHAPALLVLEVTPNGVVSHVARTVIVDGPSRYVQGNVPVVTHGRLAPLAAMSTNAEVVIDPETEESTDAPTEPTTEAPAKPRKPKKAKRAAAEVKTEENEANG